MGAFSPTDRMVWHCMYFRNYHDANSESANDFIREDESLEHFIRKQASARGQPTHLSSLFHKSAVDQRCDHRAKVLDSLDAEFSGQFRQADSTGQPQPKKQAFLQSCLMRNGGALKRCPAHVLFQGVAVRESHRLYIR